MKLTWSPWKQTEEFGAPMSDYASWRIADKQANVFTFPFIATVAAFMTMIFGAGNIIFVIWVASILAAIWLLPLPWALLSVSRFKRKVKIENERDYQIAQELQPALQSLSNSPADSFSFSEGQVGEGMKPFRVEHHLSTSLRATLGGHWFWWGPHNMKGRAVPDLLDSSTMVFLTNEAGDRTMRVLLPSPRATREMMTQIIEGFNRNMHNGSHIHQALSSFAIGDDLLLSPVTNPHIVDQLNASCDWSVENRPTVKVIGTELQPGVVLGTALEVNGQVSAFLPTGFFQRLQETVSSIAHIEGKDMPRLVQAVQ